MSSGTQYSCMIKFGVGKLICWGLNSMGECDVPDEMAHAVTKVETGCGFTCAERNKTVMCWGTKNITHQEFEEEFMVSISSFSIGGHQGCSVSGVGRVKCFGQNESGQLDVPLVLSAGVERVFVGGNNTCVIKNNHKMQCWGKSVVNYIKPFKNDPLVLYVTMSYMLYVVTKENDILVYAWSAKKETDLQSIIAQYPSLSYSPGDKFTYFNTNLLCNYCNISEIICIVDMNRKLDCTLGYESEDSKSNGLTHLSVPELFQTNTVSMTSGFAHTCAMHLNGIVKCFGDDTYGQLDVPEGVEVNVAKIKLGYKHICTINGTNHLDCYGQNKYGQIDHKEEDVWQVACGSRHTCIRLHSGLIECQGKPDDSVLDFPNQNPINSSLDSLNLSNQAIMISSKNRHTCMINLKQRAQCWGWNEFGQNDLQLGWDEEQENMESHCYPVEGDGVGVGNRVKCVSQIDAGGAHTCWIQQFDVELMSQLDCVGQNLDGQTDIPGEGYSQAFNLSAGYKHSCVLQHNYRLGCWGREVPGASTIIEMAVELQVASERNDNFVSVSTGRAHTCVLTKTGSIFCAGKDRHAAVRDQAGEMDNYAVEAAYDATCRIKKDGQFECWGDTKWDRQGLQ